MRIRKPLEFSIVGLVVSVVLSGILVSMRCISPVVGLLISVSFIAYMFVLGITDAN